MSRRDPQALNDYLEHIREARIQRYLSNVDHATSFPEFVEQHPEFPLRAAYDMRNALAHGYFKVDLDVVWKTVERDLPRLESQVTAIIRGL